MTAGITVEFRVTGAKETQRAFERLARESPARARKAVNRTVGVVRKRVIRSVSTRAGIPQRILGGSKRSGKGYIKQIKGRRSPRGWIVALVEGVTFSKLGRKTIGRSTPKPGGVGRFNATMKGGHASLFERRPPMTRISPDRSKAGRASVNTVRRNLPIREIVIPLEPHAGHAIRVHMKRAARTVYPAKLWEELGKGIKPVR